MISWEKSLCRSSDQSFAGEVCKIIDYWAESGVNNKFILNKKIRTRRIFVYE